MKMNDSFVAQDIAVAAAHRRTKEMLIVVDPEILGGKFAVFHGTRVPIVCVLDSLAAGISFERVKRSYPFITRDLIDAARNFGLGTQQDEVQLSDRRVPLA